MSDEVCPNLEFNFPPLIRYGRVRDFLIKTYHNIQGYRKGYKTIGLENEEKI